MTINILLGDNGNVSRFALEQLINSQKDKFQLVGSFSSCVEILANLGHLASDVILLGIEPECEKEQEYAFQLIEMDKAKVLLMKRTIPDEFYDRAIFAGARGVIEKNAPLASIFKAITKVYEGQLWINQETTKRLIERIAAATLRQNETESQLMSKLTSKEYEILHIMLAHASMPVKLLADKAGIKESTFRNHLTSIYGKLHIHGKFQLINYLKEINLGGDS